LLKIVTNSYIIGVTIRKQKLVILFVITSEIMI